MDAAVIRSRLTVRLALRRALPCALPCTLPCTLLGAAVMLAALPGLSAQVPLHTFNGDAAGDHFGRGITAAGDVDADGIGDVVVGSGDLFDPVPSFARVFSGASGAVLHTFSSAVPGDAFGWSVAGAGDADGDGHADIAVGAPTGSDGPLLETGAVYLYSGCTGALLWTIHGDGAGQQLGFSVDGAGDVDADGFDDVVAGLPGASLPLLGSGAVRVLSGADGSTLLEAAGAASSDLLGFSVAGAGLVDADDIPDVVAGALETSGPFKPGYALVLSGSDGSVIHTLVGTEPGGEFGRVVSGGHDVDGDGRDDIAVGTFVGGYARVFSGADASTLIDFPTSGDWWGNVAIVGDVDGDGLADVAADAFVGDPNVIVRVVTSSHPFVLMELTEPGFDAFVGFGSSLDPFDGVGDTDGDGRDEVGINVIFAAGDAGLARVHGLGPSPWLNLRDGLADPPIVPVAVGAGSLLGGAPMTIDDYDAEPLGSIVLVASLRLLGQPFAGGVLVPSPDILVTLPTDGLGRTRVGTLWPAGIPSGLTLYIQWWQSTGGGFVASNALSATTP